MLCTCIFFEGTLKRVVLMLILILFNGIVGQKAIKLLKYQSKTQAKLSDYFIANGCAWCIP